MSELEKFMKYVIFLGDGMADLPFAAPLNNKNPIGFGAQAEHGPNGGPRILYSVQTVPDGMPRQ